MQWNSFVYTIMKLLNRTTGFFRSLSKLTFPPPPPHPQLESNTKKCLNPPLHLPLLSLCVRYSMASIPSCSSRDFDINIYFHLLWPCTFCSFLALFGTPFWEHFFLYTWKPHCGIFLHFSCFSAESHFWHSSGCICSHFCCVLITWIVYLMSLLKMASLHMWKTKLTAWELYILLSSNTNNFVKSFNCSVWHKFYWNDE